MENLKKTTIGMISLIVVTTTMLYGCSKEAPIEDSQSQVLEELNEGQKLFTYFKSLNLSSIEEAIDEAEALENQINTSRSTEIDTISDAVYSVIEEYKKIDLDEDEDYESLRLKLIDVVDNHKSVLTLKEYEGLIKSIDISILAIQYAVELKGEPVSRSFWGGVKCVLGTAGSAGLGFLAGSAAGTVTVPFLGTVSGAAIGGWSGAMVGVAEFC